MVVVAEQEWGLCLLVAQHRSRTVEAAREHWFTLSSGNGEDLIVNVKCCKEVRDSALGFLPRGALPEQVVGVSDRFRVIAMSTPSIRNHLTKRIRNL